MRAAIHANAAFDGEMSVQRIALSMEVGLVLGVGGEVWMGVDISPQEFIEDTGLDNFADSLGSAASKVGEDVSDLMGRLF